MVDNEILRLFLPFVATYGGGRSVSWLVVGCREKLCHFSTAAFISFMSFGMSFLIFSCFFFHEGPVG